ncbi:MAG: carbohydrate-binding domain-containing protein [Bacteroidaceae bacterium]|nr:carbohydrate-binding domain-containing protein [Bacteroidaceae bacterium]
MKKLQILLAALLLSIAATAQTLKVTVGQVTYLFPAAQAGDMTYADGKQLTIMGKTFSISEISGLTVDNTEVTDNQVSVQYASTSATVTVAGNVAQYVEPTVSGAHVKLVQSASVSADNVDEITYTLTGTSTDGEFYLSGSYKATVELNSVTLTNATPVYSGAAVHIQNGKRINVKVVTGTTNTLTDCAAPASDLAQKACLYVKGHAEFKQKGTLNVYGKYKHAVKAGEYISLKNATLNVLSAAGDGISCNEYFLMESGAISISGVGDDGIQCDVDGTASTGETAKHEDEDSGNVYLSGGTLTVTVTASAAKAVKAEGDVSVSGGTVTLHANGAIDLSNTSDISYTAGFKADGNFTQSGGDITIGVTGGAGRGIACDGTFTTTSSSTGTLTITNSGATSSASSYHCTAKGVKAGVVAIGGGTVNVTMSGASAKGIKSDSDDGSGNMTVTGGTITVTTTGAGSYDQPEKDAKGAGCLKADGNMVISGGTLTLKSTGTGGKGIKSDGTLTISGSTLSATTTGSKYSYSSSVTASPKAIKSTGVLTISGGEVTASSSYHEGIESKSTFYVTGGIIYSTAADDALNSTSDMYLKGGYIFARSTGTSTGADGIDANGNMYIQGATAYSIAHGSPDVAFDANTEGRKQLYVESGTIVGISGLESGASLTQSCYQASSYSKGTWYGLYSNGSLVLAFQVPSSGTMGSPMVVSTAGTTTLKSGITVSSGTKLWGGYGYIDATVTGGSAVTLTSYTASSGGGGGGGGQPGGGRGR